MDLIFYVDSDETTGFQTDFEKLPSRAADRILTAIDRIGSGNLGDHKSLGHGLWEHRIHAEGGVRLYFAKSGRELILLLATGLKSDQSNDIERARNRLRDYEQANQNPKPSRKK
jgi:putative addiction module killer protein